MKTISIPLPDDLAQFVDERVKAGRYGSPSAYIQALLQIDRDKGEPLWVEEALLEGLESGPPIQVTDEMWEERKQAFIHESRNSRDEVA